MNIEEIQEQHYLNNAKYFAHHGEIYEDLVKSSKECTKITLQAIVDVLRELKLDITDIGDFERNGNKIQELVRQIELL